MAELSSTSIEHSLKVLLALRQRGGPYTGEELLLPIVSVRARPSLVFS